MRPFSEAAAVDTGRLPPKESAEVGVDAGRLVCALADCPASRPAAGIPAVPGCGREAPPLIGGAVGAEASRGSCRAVLEACGPF
jgi:hypothetical protein